MDTEPKFRCGTCKNHKMSNEFGTRQIGGVHGKIGDRLKVCLSCTAVIADCRKRKRVESNPLPPLKLVTMPPAISPSQFVDALAEYASAPKIQGALCVSLAGMTVSGKDAANHIASLVWKATGYRFTYAVSSTFACRLRWLIQLLCIASIIQKSLRVVYFDSTINVVKPEELRTTGTRGPP
jgi:hypothetical protein